MSEAPPSSIHLHFRFLAPRLMDIRTRLPAEALARDPALTVSEGLDFNLRSLPVEQPKILITQRSYVGDEQAWLESTARLMRAGWVSVLEYDDHPVPVAKVVGATPDERFWRHHSHYHAIQTSTARLAEVFRPWNSEIVVFPNAVFDLPPSPVRSGPPTIFYGAISRGSIAVEVMASLATVAVAHPEVGFVVVGDRAVFDAVASSNKRFFDYLSYDDYNAVMRGCDISLSPLAPFEGADCKSDAKFLDASRNGLVTVASPLVYEDTIVDGVTGFLARDPRDWAEIVGRLVRDAPLRMGVAGAAHAYVGRERLFAHQAAQRRDWYLGLWARRHAAARALADREPRLYALLRGRS